MKCLKLQILFISLLAVGAFLLSACAGSKEGPSADEVRAEAHNGYDDLDKEIGGTAKASSARNPESRGTVIVDEGENLIAKLNGYSCPVPDDLKGLGIAKTPREALVNAQKDIAAQIQSSIAAEEQATTAETMDGLGDESIKSSYKSNVKVMTSLANAQDARSVAEFQQVDKFGTVACMSREDAVKPFVGEYLRLKDSVLMLSAMYTNLNHPLEKQKTYKRAVDAFSRFFSARSVIKGVNPSSIKEFEADGSSENPVNAFQSVKKVYAEFRSAYSMSLVSGGESEYNSLLANRLSTLYPVTMGSCTSGLLLKVTIGSVACGEGSFGITCTAPITMNGGSCEGESYFTLTAQVKGNGRYEEAEAKERLGKNIAEGNWFDAWQKELDQWKLE